MTDEERKRQKIQIQLALDGIDQGCRYIRNHILDIEDLAPDTRNRAWHLIRESENASIAARAWLRRDTRWAD